MLQLPKAHHIHLWHTKQSNVTGTLAEQKKNWRLSTHQWIKNTLTNYYGLCQESANWQYKASGQPYFNQLDQPLYLSISHSYEYSAFTLSSLPVGVDIEKSLPRKNLSALWQHLELGKNNVIDSVTFYRLWTQLEAYTKALGSSIWETQAIASQLLTLKRSLPFYQGELNQQYWQFFHQSCDQTELSVAVPSRLKLEIIMPLLKTATSHPE